MTIDIQADYGHSEHAPALLALLQAYALDPMGGGEPLATSVCDTLIDALSKQTGAVSFLARVDGQYVGLLNAFEGFSTFKAKPLLNIHDIYVAPSHRGRGLSHQLIAAAERHARERGCCKLALEVLSGNETAKASYQAYGFDAYQLDPDAGTALFWTMALR